MARLIQTQTMIHYNSLTHLFCLSVYQDYTSIYCKDIFQSEKDKAVLYIYYTQEGLIVAVKLYIRTVNFRIIQPTINI